MSERKRNEEPKDLLKELNVEQLFVLKELLMLEKLKGTNIEKEMNRVTTLIDSKLNND